MFTCSKRRQEFEILALLGLTFAIIGITNSTAQAQTASASGSATLTSGSTIFETFSSPGVLATRTITNGVITSVSGETVLPSGYFFSGIVKVEPSYGDITATNSIPVVKSLSITATPDVVARNTSFSRAAAQILTNAAATPSSVGDIEIVTAIIRAGAGVNGLD